MQYNVLILSALAGLSTAATLPNLAQFPTPGNDNPITAPLNQIVPAGKPFTIQWKPTTPGKVTLYLLKGPSNDKLEPISTLADSIDNTGSYDWTPADNLDPTTGASGYGLELVVEGTGEYQYSTPIGISNDNKLASDSSSSSASYGAVETAPPSGSTQGTAVGGALDETATASATASAAPTVVVVTSSTAAAPVTAASASGTGSMPVVAPSGTMTVPSSLSTVATPAATQAPASGTAASAAPKSTSAISTGAAAGQAAQLTGAAALVAGLLSFLAL